MRFGKSSNLSLTSFPPGSVEQDRIDPRSNMQGPDSRSHDASPGPEAAAEVAAEVVSKAEEVTGCQLDPFVPNAYTAQLDWHRGPRAVLSRLFPRYGRYCGPNYSSGREDGSKTWDQAPVDWLDNCCYKHDMAYDTHDQTVLLEADIQLLRCLRNRPKKPNGKKVELVYPWGEAYDMAARQGLQHFLIPYRAVLIRLKRKKEKDEENARSARQQQTDERRPSLEV